MVYFFILSHVNPESSLKRILSPPKHKNSKAPPKIIHLYYIFVYFSVPACPAGRQAGVGKVGALVAKY
jgi:hypothetical protein